MTKTTKQKDDDYEGKGRRGRRRRRDVTKIRIDEGSYVDRPAQEPAIAVFLKRDGDSVSKVLPTPNEGESRSDFISRFISSDDAQSEFSSDRQRLAAAISTYEDATKRAPADGEEVAKADYPSVITTAVDGHTHLVYIHGRTGTTWYGQSPDAEVAHDHAFIVNSDGTITIGENLGHTHEVDAESLRQAMLEMLVEEQGGGAVVADVVFERRATGGAIDVENADIDEIVLGLDWGEIVMRDSEGCMLAKAALPDGTFPIRTEADLVSAIYTVSADREQHRGARSHIVKRARVLGLDDLLPDELVEIARKAAGPVGGDDVNKRTEDSVMDPKNKVEKADSERVAELEAELALAKSVGDLSDAERAHYDALEGEAQSAFLAKSADQRAAELEDIAKGDPVVYTATDGSEFRKSDDPRLVAMAKRNDEQARQLAKAAVDKAQAGFEKRATDELPNLGGDVATRAAILKAVDGIADEEVRKSALEVLKGANATNGDIFTKRGTSEAGSDKGAVDQLDGLAKAYAAEKGVDYFTAYEKVAEANPELAAKAIAG